jgi:hypothetical protein
VEVKAQVGNVNSSSTATERDTIKLPKFNGSMSWIPFHCQFKAEVKHKWADNQKAIHVLAIDDLHSIPTNVRYEDNAEGADGHFGVHPLAVVYHSHLKTRTKLNGESLQDSVFTIKQQAPCDFDGIYVKLTICSMWPQFIQKSKTRLI